MRDNVGIYAKLSLVLEPAADRCIIASEKIPKGDIIIPPISPQVSVYIGKLPDGYLDLDETFTYAKCDEEGNIKTARLVMTSKTPPTVQVCNGHWHQWQRHTGVHRGVLVGQVHRRS